MRIEITKQECKWLAYLACNARIGAEQAHRESPHPLLALRADNMADLEGKLNAAIQRQIQRERSEAR
jgi:hypothetical protein